MAHCAAGMGSDTGASLLTCTVTGGTPGMSGTALCLHPNPALSIGDLVANAIGGVENC